MKRKLKQLISGFDPIAYLIWALLFTIGWVYVFYAATPWWVKIILIMINIVSTMAMVIGGYGVHVTFMIWLLLLSVSGVYLFLMDGTPWWVKIIPVALFILSTIALYIQICKHNDIVEKQEMKEKDERIQELKPQNQYYIDLVDRHVRKVLNACGEEFSDVSGNGSLEYLICFSNNLDWICARKIDGKPDSFLIASCLMDALIRYPVIKIDGWLNRNNSIKDSRFNIYMDLVMDCVFEIISEPSTYIEKDGVWVEEKHPKVNISIPHGVIKECELYQRIRNTIYRDELDKYGTSLMQLANLFHLIYLNSK